MKKTAFRPNQSRRTTSTVVAGAVIIALAGSIWGLGIGSNRVAAAEQVPTISVQSISLTSGVEFVIEQLDYPLIEMLYDTNYLPSAAEVGGVTTTAIANVVEDVPVVEAVEYIVP